MEQQLEKLRLTVRADIFSAVQHIIGDKARKREQGFTQKFVDLLFAENCLEENVESQTLDAITSMLKHREWPTARAMKAAIQIVERANLTWSSIEGYWLSQKFS